jgi:alpha-glucosidase
VQAQQLAWWQRGAIYQIYPRSFADADGNGVGDLRGIIAHLDHLNDGTPRSLGVEAIWLSPFYPSPMADFGYDVADYCDVDPVFGTLADFDALVAEAHARDIKVVVDFVPNHTSSEHPWFKDPAKRDWYVWRPGRRDGEPPNNWVTSFSQNKRPAWTYDEDTAEWYLHSFLPQQPDLDWDNPDVEAAMHDVMRFWLQRGVDGFRIDVVQKIAKDPQLRDAVPGEPVPYEDWQPTIHERIRRLRRVVDEYPDRMLVGEVYLLDLQRIIAYVNTGDQLHLAHNFQFLHLPWSASAFRAAIDGFQALAADAAWPAWFLANHDHSRVASRYGPQRARAVLLMLYALRGTPFIYQGEELALPDALVPLDRVVDVDGRDPERAPIPWEPPSVAGHGAGFTTGEPWLPLVGEAEGLNVATQRDDPASALSLARRLAWLRRETPALQGGEERSLDAGADLLAWLRIGTDGDTIAAVVNFSREPRVIAWPADLAPRGRLLLSTDPARADGELELGGLELAGSEAVLLRL